MRKGVEGCRAERGTLTTLLALSIVAIAFVSTSFFRLSAANTSATSGLKLWKSVSIYGGVSALGWSTDGKTLGAVTDYGQKIYILNRDGELQRIIARHGDGPAVMPSLAFVNRTDFLFAPPQDSPASTAVAVWNSRTGAVERLIHGPQPTKPYNRNRAISFDFCQGRKIVAGTTLPGPNLVITDIASDYSQIIVTIPNGPRDLACSDGKLAAAGTWSGDLALVNLDTGGVTSRKILEDIPQVTRPVQLLAIDSSGTNIYATEDTRYYGSYAAQLKWPTFPARSSITDSQPFGTGVHVHVVGEAGVTLRDGAYVEPLHLLLAVAHDGWLYAINTETTAAQTEKIRLGGQGFEVSYSSQAKRVAIGTSEGVEMYDVTVGSR